MTVNLSEPATPRCFIAKRKPLSYTACPCYVPGRLFLSVDPKAPLPRISSRRRSDNFVNFVKKSDTMPPSLLPMIGMPRDNTRRPVKLFTKHRADKEVRPGHCAEAPDQIGGGAFVRA